MKRSYSLALGVIILICVGVAGSIFYFIHFKQQKDVTSFEECVKAGYQELYSYPIQCRTPDGRTFVQKLNPEQKKQIQPPSSSGPTEGDNYVPGEILVQFKQATSDDIAALFKKYNLKYKLTMYTRIPALAVVEVPKGEESKWIAVFREEPIVLTANYNGLNTIQ